MSPNEPGRVEKSESDLKREVDELTKWRVKVDESIGQLEEYQTKLLNTQDKILSEQMRSETFVDDVVELKKWRVNVSEELDQFESDQQKMQNLLKKLEKN